MNRNCTKLIRTFDIHHLLSLAQRTNATRGRSTRLSKSSDPNPTFLLFIDLTYSTMCRYRFTDCDIRSEFIKVRERTNF